ncbi:MAG: iron ABC transporter permease [Sporomusaceae bacterium]|nr:iron ABC transporter permease [Sporomusaceae bacterium]
MLKDESSPIQRGGKNAAIMLFMCLVLLALIFTGMTTGVIEISAKDFLTGNLPPETKNIINNIRVPRVIAGALVGMNLAMAGAIMQGVLRNPLASPGTLGVTAGAGLGAMAILIVYPQQAFYVPLVAFVGAMVSLILVYLLSWQNNQVQPVRLILAGVALTALFTGGMTALMVFHADKVQGAIQWLAGSFQGRSWNHVRMILPYTLIGFIGTAFSGRSLNVLALGDDLAVSLGLNVRLTRLVLMSIAGLLTASAVSVAGLLSFVGLVVPHIARLLLGSDHEALLPGAAIFGAALLVGADTAARVIMQPSEVPVGVFMSFIGAPFFLYLLRKRGVS